MTFFGHAAAQRPVFRVALCAGFAAVLVGCTSDSSTDVAVSSTESPVASTAAAVVMTQPAVVLAEFPHDPAAFTQGLIVAGNVMMESTGLEGASSLRRVDLTTGAVALEVSNEPDEFAEGLALLDGLLFQLTWTSGQALVFDPVTLDLLSTRSYIGEGWGLTCDGAELVMSNGSSTIVYRSPETFAVSRSIEVVDAAQPVENLNELEMVGGELWANVWQTDLIARIDPATGSVLGWIDVAALRPASSMADRDAVANGIAYDAAARRLFVTGKRWDTLYEIAVPADLRPA
jgi:glutaminyl-peptide cyclotransferase